MSKTTTPEAAFLTGIGLNPEAAAKAHKKKAKDEVATSDQGVPLAPAGVDPRTMPVSDIEFDPQLLDGFENLGGKHMDAAVDYVFSFYRAPGKDKERHSLLWRRIGEFVQRTNRDRHPVGIKHTKEKVRAGKRQRDLLAAMSSLGVDSVEDLHALLGKEKD